MIPSGSGLNPCKGPSDKIQPRQCGKVGPLSWPYFPSQPRLSPLLHPTHASSWEGPKYFMPVHTSAPSPVLFPPTGIPSPPPCNLMNCCSSFKTPPRFPQHRRQIEMSSQVLLSPLSLRALSTRLCSQGWGPCRILWCIAAPSLVFVVKEGFAKRQPSKCAQGRGSPQGGPEVERRGRPGIGQRRQRYWTAGHRFQSCMSSCGR